MSAQLTIIIPTVCTRTRSAGLMRAIASAKASAPPGKVTVLVVANGHGVDDELLDSIHDLPGVHTLRLEEGSLPKAQLAGRREVRTPFFAFLDDDDELLPGSSLQRLKAIEDDEQTDLAITNGWREMAGERHTMHDNLGDITADPLRALLTCNWLASCAAAFRTAGVGVEFFEESQPYAEWTWLAFRLCLAGKRVAVIDQPGYVIHDTPGSLSKTRAYRRSYLELFDRMLAANPPSWAREMVLRKRSAALHDLAVQSLAEGSITEAWNLHLGSLSPWRFGRRYFWFGRRLVIGQVKALAR